MPASPVIAAGGPELRRLAVRALWVLLAVAGAGFAAATVVGFLGRLHWSCELASHFRFQYLAALAPLAAIFALGRRWRMAAALAVAAGANAALVLPLYLPPPGAPVAGQPAFRTMLANVLTSNRGTERVLEAVRRYDPDLLVLLEVDARWLAELQPLAAGYPHSLAEPRPDNFGIGLWSRLPLENARIVHLGEAGPPSVLADVVVSTERVTVLGAHPFPPIGRAYSRLRDDQLAAVAAFVLAVPGPVVVLGDLNATPWSPAFSRLVAHAGLIDSASGFGVQPTWPAGRPLERIPIDHCLHTAGLRALHREVGADIGSDHLPLIVDLAVGPGG